MWKPLSAGATRLPAEPGKAHTSFDDKRAGTITQSAPARPPRSPITQRHWYQAFIHLLPPSSPPRRPAIDPTDKDPEVMRRRPPTDWTPTSCPRLKQGRDILLKA